MDSFLSGALSWLAVFAIGPVVLSGVSVVRFLAGVRTQASDGVDDGLCRRASRLGGCAAQDLNKQIAAELGISEMTAKIHRGQGFARCRR